ncbi:S8 family serine peptidase [Rheinheimera sp.]|uniref:S8 family serine peptidase n=1 Tax=Rheinheimera sp. TaxID=1869214 RepID=UPI0025D67822|nr:S8 family serine peptidase [Rheinheimera sp.]
MNQRHINTSHNQQHKTLTKLSALALLVGLSFGQAQANDSVSVNEAEGGNLWFVELNSQPVASGNSKKNVQAAKTAFRQAAAEAGVRYKERRAFDTLFNGFSIEISPGERAKLMQIDGVKAIYPVEVIQAPKADVLGTGIVGDMATALSMTGANIAQNSLGLDGSGIKVAVMDTGIDIDHPDFGGNGANGSTTFPTARVQYGYDFVGDAFNADSSSPSYNPVTTPDNNPDDCGGHGTHVAGIVGANGTVKGVAPAVTFGAYRVFGCNGSTTADVMIAAMERAYSDGMHVLNMSIGSAFQWPQYPTAQAADRMVAKGMVVVASIGNSGASGLYSAGAPGLGKDVIGVASFDNSHVMQAVATVNGRDIGYAPMTFSPAIPTAGGGEVVAVGEACSALPAGSLTGKIALAARGTCAFGIKAANAINAGADAVLVSNNVAGPLSGTLGAPIPNGKPVVGISLADGNAIRAMAAPVLSWTDRSGSFPSPTGGLISSFSSYGLSPDLALKPDIGAPGGNIYSTYPLESGAFATLGGTSMSSPNVAGSVALLLQAKPDTAPAQVRDILQNSADPKNWFGNPGLGYLDNVHRQGAGMLDIAGSIQATTLVTPGKIATGEGESGPYTQLLTIQNKGTEAVTYNLSSVNALSTAGVTAVTGVSTSNASVAFSSPSVEVAPGGSATVDVTITPATAPAYGQYGGYIVLTPTTAGQVYRVPFAGYVGDYQAIPTVTATANGFPWLARLNGASYSKCVADCSFSMQGNDMPFFLVHFEHQAQYMEMNILHAGNMMPVHPVFHKTNVEEFIPRNSTATGFFSFGWDGTRIHSNGGKGKVKEVPNGSYVLELKVLKALGDPNNAAHWDTWTSPVITINRP